MLSEWDVFDLYSSIDCCGCSIWVSYFIPSKRHHTSILAMVASVLKLFSLFVTLIRIIKLIGWSSTLFKNFNYFLQQLIAVWHVLIRYPCRLMKMILIVLMIMSFGLILAMRVALLKVLLRTNTLRNTTSLWVLACMIFVKLIMTYWSSWVTASDTYCKTEEALHCDFHHYDDVSESVWTMSASVYDQKPNCSLLAYNFAGDYSSR